MRQPQPAKAERLRTPDAVAGTTNKPSSPTLNPSHIKIVQGTGTFAPVPNPRARFSAHGANEDWPGAIAFGWAHTNADLLGVIDADLQHPPELLPTLISKVADGCDIAIASRYVQPHSVDGWNPLRAAISRVSLLASKPVQIPALAVKDPMSGFFVLRRKCISGLEFQPTGFKLLLEILARGQISSVTEVPFKFAPRQQGKSKASLMTAVHYFSLLWRLSFNRDLNRKDNRSA